MFKALFSGQSNDARVMVRPEGFAIIRGTLAYLFPSERQAISAADLSDAEFKARDFIPFGVKA